MTIGKGLASTTCVGLTCLYISGFYLSKQTGFRNDPKVIKSRMKAVMVASFVSSLIIWSLIRDVAITTALGLERPGLVVDMIKPLLLTMSLFLGPLSVMFFEQELPFQKHFSVERDLYSIFTTLLGQRNYLVGPLTEEFVFRACMIAVLYQANYSTTFLIFVSPLYFGLAHLHHAWDIYNKMGRTRRALNNALFSSLFQFVYTTLFGWYASYLFLRLGNIMAPVLCHSFCNIMGLPDFSGIQHQKKLHKLVIYSCFPIGIWLFIYNFQNLTNNKGESMYWK
ncbi:hypothetical protein EDC94DRAFT_249321 [Helicostylum pulchrum]|nr:hypothetical protein EDC94DRAFT_249321 [Helicostylum pulchrum]